MRCPSCGYQESKVVDSRSADDGASIRRRRECLQCGTRFTTYELARLATLDDVAYIRFASVYKDFQNVEEFSEALKELG